MAASHEGFSIREYTWRMRSADVVKCWPFDHDDEQEMRAILPQISIKKFRWWFHELHQFGTSSYGNYKDDIGEDTDEDSDNTVLRRVVLRRKGKAPKKRSIVELFAVAPEVETVLDDDDDEEEGIDGHLDDDNNKEDGVSISTFLAATNVDFGRKGKKKRRAAGNEPTTINKLKEQNKVIKKSKKVNKEKQMKMKGSGFMDFKIAKKVRSHKVRLHSPAKHAAYSNCSLLRKQMSKHSKDGGSSMKMKRRLKPLPTEKKSKAHRTSKLISHCLKPEFPLPGISKNKVKVLQVTSSIRSTLQAATQENQCGTLHSNEQVPLSAKVDICEPMRELSLPVRDPELLELCSLSYDAVASVKACAEGTRECPYSVSTNGDGCISSSTEDDVTFKPRTCRNARATPPFGDNIMRHSSYSQENYFDRYVGREQGASQKNKLSEGRYGVSSQDHSCACCAGYAKSLLPYNPQVNVHLPEHSATASNISQNVGALSGNYGLMLSEVCSKDYATAHPQSSWSSLSTFNENAIRQPPLVSNTITRNHRAHSLQHYPFPHLTTKESKHTICSLRTEKKMQKEIKTDEEHFGLPLNSQGELIKTNSCGNIIHDQLKRPSITTGYSWSLAVPKNVYPCRTDYSDLITGSRRIQLMDRLQVFPVKDFAGEKKSYFTVSSGLASAKYQLTNKTGFGLDPINKDYRSIHPLESEQNPVTVPISFGKQIPQQVTQSTMRLMGKEFSVSERDLFQLEDDMLWTDKQTIVEQLHGGNDINKSQSRITAIVNSALGLPGDAGVCSSGLDANIAESRLSPLYHNRQTNLVTPDGFGLTGGNLVRQSSPAFCRTSLGPLPKFNSVFQQFARCEYSYMSPQTAPFAHDVLDRSLISRNAQLRNDRPQATTSGFSSPVWHSVCEGQCRPWHGSPPQGICPCLTDATQKRTLMGYLPSFPDSVLDHSPHAEAMEDDLGDPSLQIQTYNSLAPRFALHKPLGVGTSSHFQPVPIFPKPSLDPGTEDRYGTNMTLKRETNSRAFARGLNLCRKASKTPIAVLLEDPTNASILRNQSTPENSCCTTAPNDCTSFEAADMRCALKVDESGLSSDMVMTQGGDQYESSEIEAFSGLVSVERHGSARTGPVKLAAGGRHVLKPCQNEGQHNSKSSQSTIRFVETNKAGKILQSEKSARVSKF